MRYKYLSFAPILFCVLAAQAQVIDFPDPVLKAKLLTTNEFVSPVGFDQSGNYIVIDANADGEITQQEALAVYQMTLDAGDITDLTGLSYFSNLEQLAIYDNPISELDISPFQNLTFLDCVFTSVTSITGVPSLIELHCLSNELTTVNVTACPNLKVLNCTNNHISTLDISNNLELTQLNCGYNQISELALHELNQLTLIDCTHNQLQLLDVAHKVNLAGLYCSYNNITSLDLTDVGIAAQTLPYFWLSCDHNNLTSLDTTVMGSGVGIRTDCSYNPDIVSIKAKNGIVFFDYIWSEPPFPGPTVDFEGTPNLQQICVDDFNVAFIQAKASAYGYTNVTVDSDCALGGENFSDTNIAVYPNPATDRLNLYIHDQQAINSVAVRNMLGQLVLVIPDFEGQSQIDISGLETGQYLINFISDKAISTTKFIKE